MSWSRCVVRGHVRKAAVRWTVAAALLGLAPACGPSGDSPRTADVRPEDGIDAQVVVPVHDDPILRAAWTHRIAADAEDETHVGVPGLFAPEPLVETMEPPAVPFASDSLSAGDEDGWSRRMARSLRARPPWLSAALDSLRASCNSDGGWSAGLPSTGGAPGPSDVLTTSLAVLVFIRAGELQEPTAGGAALHDGVRFLLRAQREDGSFGPSVAGTPSHVDVVASLALVAAWHRIGLRILREPAQRSVGACFSGSPRYAAPVRTAADVEAAAWRALLTLEARRAGVDPHWDSSLVGWGTRLPDAHLDDASESLRCATRALLGLLTGGVPDAEAAAELENAVRLAEADPDRLLHREPFRQIAMQVAICLGGDRWHRWAAGIRQQLQQGIDLRADIRPHRGTTASIGIDMTPFRAALLDLLCVLADEPFAAPAWCGFGTPPSK